MSPDENPDLMMVGRSETFKKMMESIRQVAPTGITVLITGESGTGKELAAQALHALSPRKNAPLITVNCGAIPEGILESELFGHEKGSFTGALDTRKGYFELADKGTILLDEIGEMPLSTQVKLLRILEEKAFMRVGGSRKMETDVRVLAATNKDLEVAVQRGEFRKDLYYRISAVKIIVPPLRERGEDIRLLADKFARDICRENNIKYMGFTEIGYRYLENQVWPGNIRELKNVLERILILEKGVQIDERLLEKHMGHTTTRESFLPIPLHKSPDQAERELIYRTLLDIRLMLNEIRSYILDKADTPIIPDYHPPIHAEVSEEPYDFSLKEMEKDHILRALGHYNGNRKKAARALGIGERTLYRKLKEYGIE